MSVKKIKKLNNSAVFKKRTSNDDNIELTHRIIIDARKTGELNFSTRGLSSVPDGVWTINNLTKDEINKLKNDMDFNDYDDGHEQDRWWEQETLKILNLSINSLTILDKKIEYLEDLVNLDIHDNLLEHLPDEIGTLIKLKKLNISRNKLIDINKNIFILENLRYLDLSNNNLTEINSSIGDLVMLEYLNLSNNKITNLPIGLGYLVRLETCDISNNKLIELPPDIMSMRVIKKLNASSNKLEIIPPLGEMRKLEVLILNSNNLKTFPDITGCILLKELNLSNNLIDEINMEYLDGIGQLRSILMANNEIVSIPDDIVKLLNLEQLDLSFNKLTIIPNVICIMPNLKNFHINDNPIKNIRRDIIQCGTVRILKHLRQGLDSVNHDLSKLPCSPVNCIQVPDKYTMKHTKLLSLTAQNLQEIQETILDDAITAEVTCIDFSKNKLKQLPTKMALINLIEDLKLACNQLAILPDWIGESYGHLRYLDISRNQISMLPESIGLLERLREINISFNKFKKIPECLYNILNLEIMIVSDNQIDEINADGLSKLYRLATLDLSNNNIKNVPAKLGNQQNLSHLSSVINGHCIACYNHEEFRCHNITLDWKLFQTTKTRYIDERNR